MPLDLGKLVRAETLLDSIVSHTGNKARMHQHLEDAYTTCWLACYQSSLDDMQAFVTAFAHGAAEAYCAGVRSYFPVQERELLQTSVASAQYYVFALLPQRSIDLRLFLGIASEVIGSVDSVFRAELTKKVKTQLEDKDLKNYFLGEFGRLFKERGFVVLGHEKLDDSGLSHYLFLLGEGALPDYVRRQPPGMERVIRYIDKSVDFTGVDQTEGVLDEETGNRS